MKSNQYAHSLTVFIIAFACIFARINTGYAETDVTNMVQLTKGRLMYDRVAKVSYLDVSLKNISDKPLVAPIAVVIESVTPYSVTVANASGYTTDGKPYFDYTVADGLLSPSEATANKLWIFSNPAGAKFSYTTKVIAAGLPEASAVIGPEGGVVEVTDVTSPLNGVQVTFSAGTFPEGSSISIERIDTLSGLQPENSRFVTPQFRISSTAPLRKFVTIRLPIIDPNINKPNVMILHQTDGENFWTPLPVQRFMDNGYIEFETRYFCTIAAVEMSDLDRLTQFNMDKYYKYIYPTLMEKVKEQQAVFRSEIEENELWHASTDFAATMANEYWALFSLLYPGLSSTELANLVSTSLVDLLAETSSLANINNPILEHVKNYGIDALACWVSMWISTGSGRSWDLVEAIGTCGVDAAKYILQTSVDGWSAYDINVAVEKHNDFWITADYLNIFYLYNGDLNKIAEHINYNGQPTEDNLIRKVAEFYIYKIYWIESHDYNLDEVKSLVSSAKSFMLAPKPNDDADNDIVFYKRDNCPNVFNPNQEDSNNNKVGDACEPPLPPILNGPVQDAIADSTQPIDFVWTDDPINPDTTRWCLTIKNHGADLTNVSDDFEVLNTCSSPFQLLSITEYVLPAYTLQPGSNYTWAVHAVDSISRISNTSPWSNFKTAPLEPVCTDTDNDGFCKEAGCNTPVDCDDNDSSENPGLAEICNDGKDNNCDGQINEGCDTDDSEVLFPDQNLEIVIRESIKKPTGSILKSDLSGITDLVGNRKDISNLTGLEHCINLKNLYLAENHVSDITPLANLYNLELLDLYTSDHLVELQPLSSLVNLTSLKLGGNKNLVDITPLSSLIKLETLWIVWTSVINIEPLSNMSNLKYLLISSNLISNMEPIENLVNLLYLDINWNNLSDINPLVNLINLEYLNLFNNKITDISPLVNNPGIDSGDIIFLNSNPLNDISCGVYIPQIIAKIVNVTHSCE